MRAVRSLGALALVALAACRGNRDPQAQAQSTPSGSGIAPRDASTEASSPVAASIAPGVAASAAPGTSANDAGIAGAVGPAGDAATAPGDAPGDAPTDARLAAAPAWPVAPGAQVPEFGCIGWSRKRGVMACILGSSFSDNGLDVSLVFVPLRPDAESIEPLALVEQPSRSPPPFPPDKIAPFNDLLRGFTPLDRGTARIATRWDGDKLVVDPRIIGPLPGASGATLTLQLEREGTMIFAPKYRATLWIRFAGHPRIMIENLAAAISDIEARLFSVGGTVIVERIYSVGDEGTYGTFIQLWRCTADGCDDAKELLPAPAQPPPAPPAP